MLHELQAVAGAFLSTEQFENIPKRKHELASYLVTANSMTCTLETFYAFLSNYRSAYKPKKGRSSNWKWWYRRQQSKSDSSSQAAAQRRTNSKTSCMPLPWRTSDRKMGSTRLPRKWAGCGTPQCCVLMISYIHTRTTVVLIMRGLWHVNSADLGDAKEFV